MNYERLYLVEYGANFALGEFVQSYLLDVFFSNNKPILEKTKKAKKIMISTLKEKTLPNLLFFYYEGIKVKSWCWKPSKSSLKKV